MRKGIYTFLRMGNKKDPGGRPTKKTEDLVKKLEHILERDGTVGMACRYAWISRETYYAWIEADQVFSDRMKKAKDNTYVVALEGQFDLIKWKDQKSIESFLKRRDRRYKDKSEDEIKHSFSLKSLAQWAEDGTE